MDIIAFENKTQKAEAVLNNVIKLQSIPKILGEILKYVNSGSVNNSQLAKMIVGDQSLATKILTIANSPLYSLQRNVSTIDFAVMILGIDEIRNIVYSLSIIDTFKNKTDNYLDYFTFWQHSYLVGSLAKKIGEDLSFKNSADLFTAGFLHDLGLPVIHKYFHSSFIKLMEKISEGGSNFQNLEIDYIGLSHAEIAFRLLDRWNLPFILCDIAQNHHTPWRSDNYARYAAVIHLADYALKFLNIGSFFWDDNLELDLEAAMSIGFGDQDQAEKYIATLKNLIEDQAESIEDLI